MAKAKMEKVLHHFLNLLALHETNAIVVYSQTLASQIPPSYAAHAFNVFQHAMHDFEIVRLCALWDRAGNDKENIPTVIELIDHAPIIDALAKETRAYHTNIPRPSPMPQVSDMDTGSYVVPTATEEAAIKRVDAEFGDQRASLAKAELKDAIADAKGILSDPRLDRLRNYRDKHLAHNLTETWGKKSGAKPPAKYGTALHVFNSSIPIVEKLSLWVNGKDPSLKESREISRGYVEALWKRCKFTVER